MTEKFKVLLAGNPDSSNLDDVIQNLSRLFKTDPAKIEALLKKPQAVIKTGLTNEAAAKYQTALEKAGALAKVVPVAPVAPSSPDPPPMKMEMEVKEEEKEEKEEEKGPKPKAVCPGCGYEAVSSDDPLITAHDGEGECPQCGVVPQKLIKAQEAQAQEDIPAGDIRIIGSKPGFGLLTHPATRVVMVAALILFFIGIWYWLSREAEVVIASKPDVVPKFKDLQDSQMSPPAGGFVSVPSKGKVDTSRNVFIIPAGECRTFTLSGPVPYIHSSEDYAQVEGAYNLALNEWEKHGIEVELTDSSIFSDRNQIWTAGIEKTGATNTSFIPILPNGRLARYTVDKKTGGISLQDPIPVASVEKLILQGEMPLDLAKKEWEGAWAKSPNFPRVTKFEQKDYTFYHFTATFTVNVPSEKALQKADKARPINNSSLGFGPADLVFDNGESIKTLVKGQGKSKIIIRMVSDRNASRIEGVRADLILHRDCTLTCE